MAQDGQEAPIQGYTYPSDGRQGKEALVEQEEGGQPAPEAWIGREVVIGIGTAGARLSGVLKEVNERGVILHYGTESGREPGHVFYPWSNVQAVQLPDKEQPG